MANGMRQLNYIPYATVTWKIFNDMKRPIKEDYLIESPEFDIHFNETTKTWKLGIIGRRKENEERITGIKLRRISCGSEEGSEDVRVKIVVVDRNDKILYKGKVSFDEGDEISIGSSEIFRDGIYNLKPDSNDISITCDFLFDDPFNTIDEDLKHLSTDLDDLHNFPDLCNLKLNLRENPTTVHKAIVNARCPYIARLLKGNPGLNEIDLTNKCSRTQLDGLIKYWYTGNFTEISQTQSPCNLNSVLNLEQQGLSPYIDHKATALSTTFYNDLDIEWNTDELRNKMKNLGSSLEKKYTCDTDCGKLDIYPKGESGKADYISLEIELISNVSNTEFIQVYLMDETRSRHGCKSIFSSPHDTGVYRFPEFMKYEEFDKKYLQADEEFWFGCTICKVREETASVSDPDFEISPKDPYKNFASEMKELLKSEKFSDISLKVGDKHFKVHKAILMARSEYFRDQRNLPASTDISVNVEPRYLSIILNYMYYAENTELKEMTLDSAINLYPFLYKYKIKHFQPACYGYLSRSVKDNPQKILELAIDVGDEDLKRLASQHIE